ncbi:MAG TPA: inositol monophosphatase family protein [Stellaceae bacterium]|nr:inositol monophosphatase family protein [Stellaceae bacterium]
MIDCETVANLIRETAHTLIMPRFRALDSGDIREKKPGDLVTIADIETERALTRRLGDIAAGVQVIGEEGVAEDPQRLALLSLDEPVWIIDPVDGTANFARGEPGFAVIVALARQGAVQSGWIYDPVNDRMIHAARGEGAWSEGRRLAVAAELPADQITGSAYGRAKSGQRAAKALSASDRIRAVENRGSSGLEYIALAEGRSQFSLHSRSLPWDHAAGMLIVSEAGGQAAFLDGTPYDARIPDRPLLAAASAAGWRAVSEIIANS